MADVSRFEWIKFGAPTVIAVVTIAISFTQYGLTSSFTVRQPFIAKQTELCVSASENAARLATTRVSATWQKSWEDFWMLYWGPLAMVEDVESTAPKRVEVEMIAFGNMLKSVDPTNPPLPLQVSGIPDQALRIAHACRDLLASKWEVGILKWFKHN